MDTSPKKVKDLFVDEELLKQLNYDNSTPIDKNGNQIIFDNRSRDLDSKQYKKNRESRLRKKQFIINVQKRWNELKNKNYAIIIKEFKICSSTAKKYVNMTTEEINRLDNITKYKKSKTALDDFDNIIYKMVKDDLDYKIIYAYVHYKGYGGSDSTL